MPWQLFCILFATKTHETSELQVGKEGQGKEVGGNPTKYPRI